MVYAQPLGPGAQPDPQSGNAHLSLATPNTAWAILLSAVYLPPELPNG